jgi:DNA repair exonuclease SbcCD ATPase subunit
MEEKPENSNILNATKESSAKLTVEPISALNPAQKGKQVNKIISPKDYEFNKFYWIENIGILRDEGIIFGLSNSPVAEKIDSISKYFDEIKAFYKNRLNQLNSKLDYLKTDEKDLIDTIKENKKKLNLNYSEFESEKKDVTYIIRNIVGLLFISAACIFVYFIIINALGQKFIYPSLVSIALMLVGLFGLYAKTSLFFENVSELNAKFTWKQLLLEVGLPLSVAFFIFIHAIDIHNILKAFSYFLLIALFFLFGGKLLLSIITLIQNDLTNYMRKRKLRKNSVFLNKTIAGLNSELEKIRLEISKYYDHINEMPDDETVEAKKQARIKTFLSEYELANNFSNKISE